MNRTIETFLSCCSHHLVVDSITVWTKHRRKFMNFMSVVGLITLLAIAWLLSFHKKDVKFRPVLWGIGLQFVFALIILGKNNYSFLGMALLVGLLVIYTFHEKYRSILERSFVIGAGVILAGMLFLLTSKLNMPLGWLIFAVLLVYFLTARFKKEAAPFLLASFWVTLLVWLFVSGLTGTILFSLFSEKVAAFLNLSDYGAEFLFGNLAKSNFFSPDSADFPNVGTWPGFGFLFAFKVLPTIIFFGGFMGVLYYLGIMQKIIEAISHFMRWTIGTSGAETLSCSANIFVGQTEAPLLIKPFLKEMTNSELLTIMVGGFATIAGGVLAGYIAMGVPAGHLIAASVMSAPAALVIGKIIFPEKEHSVTAGDVDFPELTISENVLEAASNGITDGFKLAVNVGAMLIGFIALIAVLDVVLNFLDSLIDGKLLAGPYRAYAVQSLSPVSGEYVGIFPGSLQTFFGNLLRPLAFLMGVPWEDSTLVGNLLGIKLSLNEFVAFGTLGDYIAKDAFGERAIVISTYALCGFANFSSIGIQIGGISALAPERRADLARVGLRAMFGGALASWTTATVAGIFL
ncbi:MAG: hypothetical protein CR997_06135 [Acidobacteria bacterium]|nr:MAG: hypothetical protein CR997_06135 [Acidobacteriota bacterium]